MTTATADQEAADAQDKFKADVGETLNEAGVSANGVAAGPTDANEPASQEATAPTANVGDQAPPPDPTSSAAQLSDWQHRIQEQEGICADREAEWQGAKEAAKEAKAEYEVSVKLLRRLIREFSDPQRKLPFDNGQPSAADPNAWRAVSIDALNLTPRIVKALTEVGITDLGKIADYTASNDGLNGITGIGPAAREQVSDAMENYWGDHPQPSLETTSDESADDETDDDDLDDDTGEEDEEE